MVEATYFKIDIAREYLDAAINFFLARDNLFCAIHLAAAAEELFGAHLPKPERIFTIALRAERAFILENPMLPEALSDADVNKKARKNVNEWSNKVKHMDDGESSTLEVDPAFPALDFLPALGSIQNRRRLEELRESPQWLETPL